MFGVTLLAALFSVCGACTPEAPSAGRLVAYPAADSPGTATCVFQNPGYSGQCVQTQEIEAGSTAQQTCESILACLNNVHCTKTYCQATTVRGGWTLESATAGGH
jgi:hypothetical protein